MNVQRELRRIVDQVRSEIRNRWQDASGDSTTALAQFLKPNLGPTPPAARRFLEPVVAGSALVALAVLLGWATTSCLALFVAAGLIYAIITYVFGIQLDIAMPSSV